MPTSLDAVRRLLLPGLTALMTLLAAASVLQAQTAAASSAPTLRAESNGEVQLSTGKAPSFTITTSCPAEGSGTRCLVWLEPASEEVTNSRTVQWQVTRTTGACAGVSASDFRDVTGDPESPLAEVSKGATCTLTLAFRLTGDSATSAISADVVRNVSLYITTPD